MQAQFTISLDLYDDEDDAREFCDEVLTALRSVKRVAKKITARATTPAIAAPRAPKAAPVLRQEPAEPELPLAKSEAPALQFSADATTKTSFQVLAPALPTNTEVVEDVFANVACDSPSFVGSVSEAAPKRRGRGKAKSVSEQVYAPAAEKTEVVAVVGVGLEDVAPVDTFSEPITSLQELIDLGNLVCKECGPKIVADVCLKYKGRYAAIPQDKWTEVAAGWRRALRETVKA